MGKKQHSGSATSKQEKRHGTHLVDEGNEDEEARGNDGLLVDDVELLRDGGGEKARAEDGGAGFGDETGGGGEGVDDLGRALFRRGLRRARHAPAECAEREQESAQMSEGNVSETRRTKGLTRQGRGGRQRRPEAGLGRLHGRG